MKQEITLNQAKPMIEKLLSVGIVPFLQSSPALGKSSLIKQIAKEQNLQVIDLRLTELESSDINGLPYFENGKSTFLPFDTFPLKNTPLPKGKKGWILLLDELPNALPSVQCASYKLILDRMVGQHQLHDKCYVVACGNLDTDNAMVNPMSTALISRFAHFYIKPDVTEWREWAINQNIDSRITAFLGFRPELLYTFNALTTEPYASPRTWEMLSKVITGETNVENLPFISSLLGTGVATEFISYLKIIDKIPNIKKILTKPDDVNVPEELSIQWATITAITRHADLENNINNATKYIDKFPAEMRVVFLRELYALNKSKYAPLLREWSLKLSEYLHG